MRHRSRRRLSATLTRKGPAHGQHFRVPHARRLQQVGDPGALSSSSARALSMRARPISSIGRPSARKWGGEGKSGSVRVDLGGRSIIKIKKHTDTHTIETRTEGKT